VEALPAEPGWDLDPKDPAVDLARRYVRATRRYGDRADCVTPVPAGPKDGAQRVELRDNPAPRCARPDAGGHASSTSALPSVGVRDVLTVDPANAMISASPDAPSSGPLKPWPDDSDPAGPPKPVASLDGRDWRGTLRDWFVENKFTILRVQLYGRGTYPIVTLAGWRDPIARSALPAALKPTVEKMCVANDGQPFGIFAGLDRSTLLRVRCPSSARWEKL
jgi:hypothetical protein